MLDIISVLIVLIVLYSIISIPVGLFNIKVFQAIYYAKPSGVNLIKAFLPLYNITFARKLAYGQATVANSVLLVCVLLAAFRIVALVLVSTFPVLIVYSSIVMIACIAMYWALYIFNCVDFCRMFNCGVVTTLCGIVVAPIGYYMLSTQVMGYFRSVEDEVSGRFGDSN